MFFSFNGSRKGSSALEEYVSRMSNSSTSSAAALAKMGIKNEAEPEPSHLPHQQQSTPQPRQQTPQSLPFIAPDQNNLTNFQLMWKQLNGQLPNAFQGIFKQQQATPPPQPIVPTENDQVNALVNSILEQQKGLLQNHFNTSGNNTVLGNSFNGGNGNPQVEDLLKSGEALTGNALKRILEQRKLTTFLK